MRRSNLTRRQRLVVLVMALALVAVLVALGSVISGDVPASPLATAVLVITRTTRPTQIVATPSPVVSPSPSPTKIAAEVLAARRIETLGRDVGRIRELPKQQEIPLNFLGAQEMASYLRNILADSERRSFIALQHPLFAALDLLPDPAQVLPPSIQTRARHLVAFYDTTEDQIFIGPLGRDSEQPDISLIHQYAHAYVDQHFDLQSFKAEAPNSDAARARDALMEGDSMAVLALHSFGAVDQDDIGELAGHLAEVELTDYEAYPDSRAMDGVFLFPYLEGTYFVTSLLQAGWWPAVNMAYLDPPVSTEQILHPEKYVNSPRDEPRAVRLPDLGEDLGEGWRLVGQDVLGELILRAHLDQYLFSTQEAHVAAAGWDGDLAALWYDLDGREVLVMRIYWDSTEEATEFVRSYNAVVDRRLRGARRVMRSILPRGGSWWRGDMGNAFLLRERDSVLIVWAPDTDTMERILAVFVFGEE